MEDVRATSGSPDPLLLDEVMNQVPQDDDVIVVEASSSKASPRTPRKPRVQAATKPTTPKGRKRKAEEEEEPEVIELKPGSALKRKPSKRTKSVVDEQSTPRPKGRPPGRKAQPQTPTVVTETNGNSVRIEEAEVVPTRPTTPRKRAVPKKYENAALESSASRKPRTPRIEPNVNNQHAESPVASSSKQQPPPPHEEEDEFESSSDSYDDEDTFELDSKTSRAKFLENERRRKANQARNFVYTGDATEARKLRSGKAVAAEVEEEGEIDLGEEDDGPGDEIRGDAEEAVIDLGVDIDYNLPEDLDVQDAPIPNSASLEIGPPTTVSPYIYDRLNDILDDLSAPPSRTPPPFASEGPENEALTSLVNLIRGTVERGEGNSCLVVGSKGSGKTRTVNRAINIVEQGLDGSSKADRCPIIVRLDGLAQVNDMLAIREMGRQIAYQEGKDEDEAEDDETSLAVDASAPTTLPSHLLTFLTASSPRSIIVVIEGFDLFTEHARQALLYCLLDVVQSVRTGPVESTGRGVAVVGVTSRVDTPLLLEKRVKSRFSQRIFRVVSPLALDGGAGWKSLLMDSLVHHRRGVAAEDMDKQWDVEWSSTIERLMQDETVERAVGRLCGLTTDPRILYRPFSKMIVDQLDHPSQSIAADTIVSYVQGQTESTGWGKRLDQLHGLSQPDLVLLIIAKHFSYAGKEEFNFAMAEHEYVRFARTELAASGRTKWSGTTLQTAWEHLLSIGLFFPATRFKPNTNPHMQRFIICRSLLTRSEIIGFFKGEGAKMLSTELANWGRMAGGHA